MKTSEFIKYFEDENITIKTSSYKDIRAEINGGFLFAISRNNTITTAYNNFGNLPFLKQQEYYKVIFEYLMTPIEEREEEKKYYLRQMGIKEPHNILNFKKQTQNYKVSTDDRFFGYKTQFTQKEIDNMPECYTHPAVWEQVEVECGE